MTCRRSMALVLATLMLQGVIVYSSDHEIAWYGRIKGQRPDTAARIWLMERDGSNPIYVYETCGWSYPSWSPDGSSLLILQEGYRDVPGFDGVLRLDLTNPPTEPPAPCPEFIPPRILNTHGTIAAGTGSPFEYLDGVAYSSTYLLKWSPLGDEIAFEVSGGDLDSYESGGSQAIVVANPANLCDQTGCQSVTPIYHATDQYFWSFDWSPDGTQFVIVYDVDRGGGTRAELAIIERADGSVSGGPWIVNDITQPGAADMDHLAWAPTVRGGYWGPVIAFDALAPVGKKYQERIYLLDLGVENPIAEEIVDGWRASWSPDSEFLAVEIWNENPEVFEFSTRVASDLGDFWFARSPDWRPGYTSSGCSGPDECNDSNPCTTDTCESLTCFNRPNTDPCDDADSCTDQDFCSQGHCRGDPFDGAPLPPLNDLGWCCSGEFLPDATDCPACTNRGTPCYFDEECCSLQCHPIKGTCK